MSDSWDFGLGAGFYVNATTDKWKTHFNMYKSVTEDLPHVVGSYFPVDTSRASITGHSMGGHGAMVCAFKNPGKYVSVSAFSPICNPTKCPWGVKAFTNYLGSVEAGVEYDSVELIKKYNGPHMPLLVD
jgi:S-formylglutathione hydrolase